MQSCPWGGSMLIQPDGNEANDCEGGRVDDDHGLDGPSDHTVPPTTVPPTTTSPPTTVAPPPPAAPAPAAVPTCSPVAASGNCYQAGEFCSNADHGLSGTTASGEGITCEDNNGWRWEPS